MRREHLIVHVGCDHDDDAEEHVHDHISVFVDDHDDTDTDDDDTGQLRTAPGRASRTHRLDDQAQRDPYVVGPLIVPHHSRARPETLMPPRRPDRGGRAT